MPEARNLNPKTRRRLPLVGLYALAIVMFVVIGIVFSELWETPPGGEGLIAPNAPAGTPEAYPPGLIELGIIQSGGEGLGGYKLRLYRYQDGRNTCYLAWERGVTVGQYCLTEDRPPPE